MKLPEISIDNDERLGYRLAAAVLLSFISIPVITGLIGVPLHELLHAAGAYLVGGQVQSINLLNVDNWASTYLYPMINTGALGTTTAVIPDTSLGKLVFFFLPYPVLLVASGILILADEVGLPLWTRIVGGALLWNTWIAFWNELALYRGTEVFYPLPPAVHQALYVSIIVAGLGASTWYFILQDNS